LLDKARAFSSGSGDLPQMAKQPATDYGISLRYRAKDARKFNEVVDVA